MEDEKKFDGIVTSPDFGVSQNIENADPDLSRVKVAEKINQQHAEIYLEALEKYPNDEAIDQAAERRLRLKLDLRIIPLLGVCYFFYYVDKTTLSYAAIFGIETSLDLHGTQYSWLSSAFYLGWLIWAIPSNLIMQRFPPAYYLAFNIFMWGALLMIEASVHNFVTLIAIRVLSGAFEAIADPAFMLITSMFYTRPEQPNRIAMWYIWNGIGVAGGGLIGYGIGNIHGALTSWRYEFIIVGAFCAFWAIMLLLLLPNSPATFWGFSHEERLMMIARVRKNQTGVEQHHTNWGQVREAYLDYKTWLFTLFGVVGNIPNGGISNFSTLVIQGLGFGTLDTALLGIPQGMFIVLWISLACVLNAYMPKNSRCLVGAIFMLPTIAGALGFLLAPADAYVGRLLCFYMTGSYQASFVIALSLITSNTGGQSKKMIVAGMIWFGGCIGNVAGPFFYKADQAPSYHLGIGSLLVANCIELLLLLTLRQAFIWENKKKEELRARLRGEAGDDAVDALDENATAFTDMTDKENPNFVYIY